MTEHTVNISTVDEVLSLQVCQDLALENNKKLMIADKEILAAKAVQEEAFTKYLPAFDAAGLYLRNQKRINLLAYDAYLPVGILDANGSWTLGPDNILMQNGQPVLVDGSPVPKEYALLPKESMSADIRNTALIQVGMIQPVYLGGKIRAYNQIAGLSGDLAYSNQELELQNVILQVDEAYWQVVSLVNKKILTEKYVETLKQLEYDVNLMFETGLVTKADVLTVKVRRNEAEMNNLRVEDGLNLSRMHLNQVCGLPTNNVYVLQDEVVVDVQPENVVRVPMEMVYALRPEIASLEITTEIFRKKEKIALSEYMPNVAVLANYITHTPSFYDGIKTKFDGMWSVGVGVQAPIFHWGSSRKSLRSAKAQTEIVEFTLQEAKEQIELQVSQAEFKIREVAKKLEMAKYNLETADENLKLANLAFQEGTASITNVLEAQTAWLSAHSDLIDAQIEMKLSEVYLKKAYGTLSV
ncbi:MAG: TolC family protein [Odoribacter sp.]|nr:TolC family protein [Odoribacter sp.]